MTYKLSEIDLDEVSLVTKGAVPRKFLVAKTEKPLSKEDTHVIAPPVESKKIVIESDGTKQGTKITIGGQPVEASQFNFSFWSDSKDNEVNCSYSKVVANENGFTQTEDFRLAGDKDIVMASKAFDEIKNEIKGLSSKLEVQKDSGIDEILPYVKEVVKRIIKDGK
jgi:hypothetical protein